METLRITRENQAQYLNTDLKYEGHIEFDEALGCLSFKSMSAKGRIYARAGTGIEAGEGIKAGWGIEAGEGIKAGANISVKLRIFAGLVQWRKPEPRELEIRCKRLEGGEVAYGNLIESGKE